LYIYPNVRSEAVKIYCLSSSKYKTILEKLKLPNLKARHFVVAYRYLNEFNQIIEYSTDDGEPNGTY